MNSIVNFVSQHEIGCVIAAYALFSSFVSGMPTPDDKSSVGYRWAFNSLHALALNFGRIPQVRSFVGGLVNGKQDGAGQ